MAYSDTKCVCGSKKLTDSLLCAECCAKADVQDMRAYSDSVTFGRDFRRAAAIRLLAFARRRKMLAA